MLEDTNSLDAPHMFAGVTQEEIDDKRVETEKHMLDDLKKWVAEGRDLDRDFRDASGATPVGIP